MLKQAVGAGIEGLLKVPIVLLMVCVLFYENATLPQTRTKIVRQIFELTVDRTILKQPELKEVLGDLLLSLGELSWKALQSDVQQLLLPKVRCINLLFAIFKPIIHILNNTQLALGFNIYQGICL